MYRIGDQIVYASIGVCSVEGIEVPAFCPPDKQTQHYVLKPREQSGIIFIPIDSPVFMRPVISREEAERLIDLIPTIQAEACNLGSLHDLTRHYAAAFETHDCADLIELVMSIYAKRRTRLENNLKIGAVDEAYMKRGENLLYSEFSVALGIPKDEVGAYISKRVKALEKIARAHAAQEDAL